MTNLTVEPVDCETVVRALWAYLDRQLGDAERAAIDAHLEECEHCRAHTEFERRLISSIGAIKAEGGEEDALRARVLDALRHARSRHDHEGET
jgi:mycothiol system anti-sigma-R factor